MSRKKRLQKKAEKGKKAEAKQQAFVAKAAAKPKRKRVKRTVVEGRAYIKSTFNNMVIVLVGDHVTYDPKEIDILFVTHAHVDHLGRIPKLINEGFRGKIYSTLPTRALAMPMLEISFICPLP